MGSRDDGKTEHVPGGYVLLARSLEQSPIWGKPDRYIRLWIYLLMNARWDSRPRWIGDVEITRGQLLKSYRKIAEENQREVNNATEAWSPEAVRRMLDWMEKGGMIERDVTGLGTLITIRNFPTYQDPAAYDTELVTEHGTAAGQPRDNRKKGKKGKNTSQAEWSEGELAVFGFWKTHRAEVIGKNGGPPMQPTRKRLSKIRARLAEGYTPDQLREAIRGCLGNDFNVEGGHTDIELICRDQAHVEQYRAWAKKSRADGRTAPRYGPLP